MRRFDNRLLWGLLLVGGGFLFLLQNLGVFQFNDLFWALVFGIIGIVFLVNLFRNPQNWWSAIPGLILVYLAALIVFQQLFPALADDFGGPLFLAVIGLAFWIIYFLNTLNWWAVIPGGVLITLAIVSGADRFLGGVATGGLFFLGIGLTFIILSWIHTPQGRMRWPLIPGGILLVFGLLLTLSETSLLKYLWPLALILAGLYLFLHRFLSKS